MKKKIIIDLAGVVLQPIVPAQTAAIRAAYGPIRGDVMAAAYRRGVGEKLIGNKIGPILYDVAAAARPIPGAIDAVAQLVQMPDTEIEFCSQLVLPADAEILANQYRAISPAMAAAKYSLISPFASRDAHLHETTAAAGADTMNYIVASDVQFLKWPAKWRISPVLIDPSMRVQMRAHFEYGARGFANLAAFADFMQKYR